MIAFSAHGERQFDVCVTDLSNGNITVIGDVMLDRFWSGVSRRVSPEAPVPVVNINGRKIGRAAPVTLLSIWLSWVYRSRSLACAETTTTPAP